MKKVWIIVSLLLPVQLLHAQEQKSVERTADEFYLRHEYARAASLYKRMAAKKKVKTQTISRLAESYRKINAYADAAQWYAKLVTLPDAPPESGLYYGDMLKSQGKYDSAKAVYAQYAQTSGRAAVRIAGCDSALQWMKTPTMHRLAHADRLNTRRSDWGAAWPETGFVFMSDSARRNELEPGSRLNKNLYGRNRHQYYKLYKTDTSRNGGVYVNDFSPTFNQYQYHIGPVAFQDNGRLAYVTIDNPERRIRGEKEKFSNGIVVYGTRRLELVTSKKDSSGRWSAPEAFQYNKPEAYSIGHATFSSDGQLMYFTSDMPGGTGATDIWYSEKQADGTWGTPVNCGATVNTPEEEAFPVIAPDGRLYFSSKGLAGMGGYDIFSAAGSKTQWTAPENMRSPLNSPGDDFHLVWKENGNGFLTSNRPGGYGDDDIYFLFMPAPAITPVTPPSPLIPLVVNVCPPFRASCIYLYNVQRDIGWCFTTDADGKFYFKAEPETDYVLRFTQGNRRDSIVFNTRGRKAPEPMELDACPQQLKQGSTFILHNLYYDYNKSAIRPDAAQVLDSLAGILRSHPTMRIELGAHTDSRGSASYNRTLSQQRAAAAVAYLVKTGIDRKRLEAKGYGDTKILNRCTKSVDCSDREHEENRRTEVKILNE